MDFLFFNLKMMMVENHEYEDDDGQYSWSMEEIYYHLIGINI